MSLADLQRFMIQVESEVKAGEQWTEVPGRHVIVHYVASPGLNPSQATLVFDGAIESDCKALKIGFPSEKVPVYLYPNSEDLARALRANISFPQGGISLGAWSAIIAPRDWNAKDISPIAAQQLGFALVHSEIGLYGWPVFNEGIALYFRGVAGGAHWVQTPLPVEPARITDLVTSARTAADFQEGASFLAYLVKMDGGNPDRLTAVLRSIDEQRLRDLRSPNRFSATGLVDQSFQTVYGHSLAQLEHQWRQSI